MSACGLATLWRAIFRRPSSALVLTEAVIPGLAPPPPIFVAPEENHFLWHFMFNQLTDLPETLTYGRESQYLTYIFNRWSHRRDRVAARFTLTLIRLRWIASGL